MQDLFSEHLEMGLQGVFIDPVYKEMYVSFLQPSTKSPVAGFVKMKGQESFSGFLLSYKKTQFNFRLMLHFRRDNVLVLTMPTDTICLFACPPLCTDSF